jgi:hypothetical protein
MTRRYPISTKNGIDSGFQLNREPEPEPGTRTERGTWNEEPGTRAIT